MKLREKIEKEFNVKKQAEELGVSIWRTPSMLFILMGLVSASSMVGLYLMLGEKYSPEFLVSIEALSVVFIFTLGTFTIRNFEVVAQANKMKSEFVSIASHQLKSPLSRVSWCTELLLDKYKKGLSEDQLEIIHRIEKSNEDMSRLVKDLLDVAKIDQGNLFLASDSLNIEKLIDDVILKNRDLLESSKTQIKMMPEEKLPEVVGDAKHIYVVLDNLISNAIKYTKSEGQVEITIEKKGDMIVVCVKDNGIGIPEAQQARIFEKFFRSDNVEKLEASGTGLGLYISNNIVKQSGGKMWFKSIEEVGSLFCFSLPIKKERIKK